MTHDLEAWRHELQAHDPDSYAMAPTALLLELVREVLCLRASMEIMASHVAALQPREPGR